MKHTPAHTLRLISLLRRCKCDMCQKELKKLLKKYDFHEESDVINVETNE
jgi:hypothetical protein